jgi:hypothetical protein
MEGGIRTPFVAMWPGKIQPGQVSGGMVHEVDLFPTLMAAAGVPEQVPRDRAFDGVNQLEFLKGRHAQSSRESALFLAREGHLMAVKWRNWKLWYYFKTEEEPEGENLVRLFDLEVDPREETDVKDFYPWVIPVMDSLAADFEASLVQYPRVPRYADDPYQPPEKGSGSDAKIFSRSDRDVPGPRSDAIEGPDFSGSWSSTFPNASPPRRGPASESIPDLGSGWGDQITIVHSPDTLMIERTFFVPREIQPPIRYRYAMNGGTSNNPVTMGRSWPAPESTTRWDGNRLVVTTTDRFRRSLEDDWQEARTEQTLWMEYAETTPWEPSLVVETTRYGSNGEGPVTNRTTYYGGYR